MGTVSIAHVSGHERRQSNQIYEGQGTVKVGLLLGWTKLGGDFSGQVFLLVDGLKGRQKWQLLQARKNLGLLNQRESL